MRCDVCLGEDSDAVLSPDLPPLLYKHLGITVQEILSCGACSQLLHLWDDFSDQAKTNLSVSHPDSQQQFQDSNSPEFNMVVIEKVEHCTPELLAELNQTEVHPQNNDFDKPYEDLPYSDKQQFYDPIASQVTTHSFAYNGGEANCSEYVVMQSPVQENETFRCVHCNKAFLYEKSLQMHERSVHGDKIKKEKSPVVEDNTKLSCPICHGRLSTQFQMNQHIRLCHPEVADAENSKLRSKANPNYHIPSEFVCETCGVDLESKVKLENHMKMKHSLFAVTDKPKKTYTCPHCPQIFKSKKSVPNHIKKFHNNAVDTTVYPYNCHLCTRGFFQKNGLVTHLRFHYGSQKKVPGNQSMEVKEDHGPSERDVLLSIAETKYKLRDGFYFCNFCLKSDKSEVFIKNHIVEFHLSPQNQSESESEDSDKGESSQMQSNSNAAADVSLSNYFTQKRGAFTCKICGKVLATLHGVDYHILLHLSPNDTIRRNLNYEKRSDSVYACLLCGKTLGSEVGMLSHLRTHDNNISGN